MRESAAGLTGVVTSCHGRVGVQGGLLSDV